jgi:hypothetical protein
MVKEFEMRKAADQAKRTMTAKSGMIDSKKLYKYSVASDIFKKYNIIADSTNHGFIMVVDWSGSMSGVLKDVIKQLLVLVNFCRRVGIKFEVFAFTDKPELQRECFGDDYVEIDGSQLKHGEAFVRQGAGVVMLKLFDDSMTQMELERMSRLTYSSRFSSNGKYALGGTPLTSAMLFVNDRLPSFIKQKQIQKTSVIVLTDGEDAGSYIMNSKTHESTLKSEGHYSFSKVVQYSFFDKRTNVCHRFPEVTDSTVESRVIFSNLMIAMRKAHDNVNFIGMHVIPMNAGWKNDTAAMSRKAGATIQRAIRLYIPGSLEFNSGRVPRFGGINHHAQFANEANDLRAKMDKEDAAVMETPMFDKMFFIAGRESDIKEDLNIKATKAQNSRQVAKAFGTAMKTRNSGKFMAETLVKLVA